MRSHAPRAGPPLTARRRSPTCNRCAGLNETHFDIVKGLFGDALARAGATPLVISQAAAVMETTRRILFPLDAPQPQAAEQQPAAAQQQQQQPAAEQQARGCPAGAAAAGRRPQ